MVLKVGLVLSSVCGVGCVGAGFELLGLDWYLVCWVDVYWFGGLLFWWFTWFIWLGCAF